MKKLFLILMLILLVSCLPSKAIKPEPALAIMPPQANVPSLTGAIPVDITATITHSVLILGKQGFDEEQIIIEQGNTISWINHDPDKRSNIAIAMRKSGDLHYTVSPVIGFGEHWEHQFTQKGEYTFWTSTYGVMGKITVE